MLDSARPSWFAAPQPEKHATSRAAPSTYGATACSTHASKHVSARTVAPATTARAGRGDDVAVDSGVGRGAAGRGVATELRRVARCVA